MNETVGQSKCNETNGVKIDKYGKTIFELTKRIINLENDVADTVVHISAEMTVMNCTIATMVGRLARSEICNSRILNELSDMRSHSMKNNLIITYSKQDKLNAF